MGEGEERKGGGRRETKGEGEREKGGGEKGEEGEGEQTPPVAPIPSLSLQISSAADCSNAILQNNVIPFCLGPDTQRPSFCFVK